MGWACHLDGQQKLGAGLLQPQTSASSPHPPQALLLVAHEVELQRQKEAEKLERQLALPSPEQVATQVSPRCPFCTLCLLPTATCPDATPVPAGDHVPGDV